MTHLNETFEDRLVRMERRNRMLTAVVTVISLVVGSAVSMAFTQARLSEEPLRVRGLIVEDAQGRARILIGAPIPDRNARGNPRAGMIINDSSGVERFGLGLQDSGRLVMGLDAPVGKGDDRNRERITLVADENGGTYFRFLDRTTSVPARMYLDEQNRVWLEFTETQSTQIVRRRIGATGDETSRTSR
jgi:hypothetical protein